jgi:hypothetical protein
MWWHWRKEIAKQYACNIQRKYDSWKLENLLGYFYELAMRDYKKFYETQLTKSRAQFRPLKNQI